VLVRSGVETRVETDVEVETEVDLTCCWVGGQLFGVFGSIDFVESLQQLGRVEHTFK
jgi:hypothetical protein